MIKKLTYIIATLMGVFVLNFSTVLADACPGCGTGALGTKQAISCGTKSASGDCSAPAAAADKANTTLQRGINLLSVVGGILAVVFLILGGYKYITSNGASDKVGSAKNTILYALIGLVVIALAQVLVKFVLTQVTPEAGSASSSTTTTDNGASRPGQVH